MNLEIEASLALRTHFCSRSTQLIAPLARYLNSLIPSPTEVQHARKTSTLTPSLSSSAFPSPAASPMSTFSSPAFKSNTSRSSLASTSIPSSPVPTTTLPSARPPRSPYLAHRSLQLKPFNSDHFFASLKAHGSTLPFKSTAKRTQFYERYVLLSPLCRYVRI